MKRVEDIVYNGEVRDFIMTSELSDVCIIVEGIKYYGEDIINLANSGVVLGLVYTDDYKLFCHKYTNKDESFLNCVESIDCIGNFHRYHSMLKRVYNSVRTLGVKVHEETLTKRKIYTLTVADMQILQNGALILNYDRLFTLCEFIELILSSYKIIDCDIYVKSDSDNKIYKIEYNSKFVAWFTKRRLTKDVKNN